MKHKQMLMFDECLAKRIGLNEAIIFQKILYWQQKCPNNEWIYNSYKDWQKQFEFLSICTIQRTFSSLQKHGLLKCKKTRFCNFYQVDDSSLQDSTGSDSVEAVVSQADAMQMMKIWEARIPTAGKRLSLTELRKNTLAALLVSAFDSSLSKWKEFVELIAQSDFLMGRVANATFKVSLDWAIKSENCLKILEGAYANKDVSKVATDIAPHELEGKAKANFAQIKDKNWQMVAKLLAQHLGCATYCSWFSKVKFIAQENKRIHLEAQSKFIADWIESHYCNKIRHLWNQATNGDISEIVITPSHEFKAENYVSS